MRFFSKFVTICNICFVIVVILHFMEYRKNLQANNNSITSLTWIENVLVILGYGAFFINIIFLAASFIFFIIKKENAVPKWMLLFTMLIFSFQLLYFFTNLFP